KYSSRAIGALGACATLAGGAAAALPADPAAGLAAGVLAVAEEAGAVAGGPLQATPRDDMRAKRAALRMAGGGPRLTRNARLCQRSGMTRLLLPRSGRRPFMGKVVKDRQLRASFRRTALFLTAAGTAGGCAPFSATPPFHFAETATILRPGEVGVTAA